MTTSMKAKINKLNRQTDKNKCIVRLFTSKNENSVQFPKL